MKTFDKNFIIITAIFLSVMAGITFVSGVATARPTAQPANENYPGKVLYNDARAETKNGALTINGTLTADTIDVSGDFTPDTLCFAGDCRSLWPNLSQPNWTIQNVVNTSGSVSNQVMLVGQIRMKSPNTANWYYSKWPVYKHDNAWGAVSAIGTTTACPSTRIMSGITWAWAGITEVRCYETLLWPYQN